MAVRDDARRLTHWPRAPPTPLRLSLRRLGRHHGGTYVPAELIPFLEILFPPVRHGSRQQTAVERRDLLVSVFIRPPTGQATFPAATPNPRHPKRDSPVAGDHCWPTPPVRGSTQTPRGASQEGQVAAAVAAAQHRRAQTTAIATTRHDRQARVIVPRLLDSNSGRARRTPRKHRHQFGQIGASRSAGDPSTSPASSRRPVSRRRAHQCHGPTPHAVPAVGHPGRRSGRLRWMWRLRGGVERRLRSGGRGSS